MELAKEIYEVKKNFPKEERYEMTKQLRKASTSILANLAEGCGKYTYADKAHKFVIARGECSEVTAFVLFCIEVGFLDRASAQKALTLTTDVGKMLSGLIKYSHNSEKLTT